MSIMGLSELWVGGVLVGVGGGLPCVNKGKPSIAGIGATMDYSEVYRLQG